MVNSGKVFVHNHLLRLGVRLFFELVGWLAGQSGDVLGQQHLARLGRLMLIASTGWLDGGVWAGLGAATFPATPPSLEGWRVESGEAFGQQRFPHMGKQMLLMLAGWLGVRDLVRHSTVVIFVAWGETCH